jgi:hypothetical protein
MPLIDVRPITSLHESFTGQSHWLELPAERKRRRITQSRMRPNHAMQRIPIWRWTPNGQAKDSYHELLHCLFKVDKINTREESFRICRRGDGRPTFRPRGVHVKRVTSNVCAFSFKGSQRHLRI